MDATRRDASREVVVVVPCFNEAHRLAPSEFRDYAERNPAIGFLFVDDGSSDGTADLIETALTLESGGIRLRRIPENRGKAEAVRVGMVQAMGEGAGIVGYFDADLATPLEEIGSMVRLLKENEDLEGVLGSRVRLLGHQITRYARRHYLGRVFATLASLTLELPVYDTQCGAKLFRTTEALRAVVSSPFTSAWIFDVELLARLRVERGDRLVMVLEEYPLRSWADVGGSKLGLLDMARALVDLARIRRTLRRGAA